MGFIAYWNFEINLSIYLSYKKWAYNVYQIYSNALAVMLNRKFTLRTFNTAWRSYQNVTFGKCEICEWPISIILGVLNLCSNLTFFYIFKTCKETLCIRLICEELVRFFSDAKNWYSISKLWRIATNFLHMWRIGAQFSQIWRIGTKSQHMW